MKILFFVFFLHFSLKIQAFQTNSTTAKKNPRNYTVMHITVFYKIFAPAFRLTKLQKLNVFGSTLKFCMINDDLASCLNNFSCIFRRFGPFKKTGSLALPIPSSYIINELGHAWSILTLFGRCEDFSSVWSDFLVNSVENEDDGDAKDFDLKLLLSKLAIPESWESCIVFYK